MERGSGHQEKPWVDNPIETLEMQSGKQNRRKSCHLAEDAKHKTDLSKHNE